VTIKAMGVTILRNRAYLGEVYFRGRHYPAPHEPLVEAEPFERAAELLRERGEDSSLRRSNQSDYLLPASSTASAAASAIVAQLERVLAQEEHGARGNRRGLLRARRRATAPAG
jgi:hypothetical protein